MSEFIPNSAEKKQTEDFVVRWQDVLNLHDWRVRLTYAPAPDPEDDTTTASSDMSGEYLYTNITIYPGYFAQNALKREMTMLHELVHCIVQETNELMRQLQSGATVSHNQRSSALERSVCRITKIIYDETITLPVSVIPFSGNGPKKAKKR